MYLFDTDIITSILKKSPSKKLLKKIKSIKKSQQFISTITIYEIVYGAYKSKKPDYHLKNLNEILVPSVNVISFNSKAAYICGRLRAELDNKGTPISLSDLEIASIAIANDFILITGNIKHFERIKSLNVENWI